MTLENLKNYVPVDKEEQKLIYDLSREMHAVFTQDGNVKLPVGLFSLALLCGNVCFQAGKNVALQQSCEEEHVDCCTYISEEILKLLCDKICDVVVGFNKKFSEDKKEGA